MITGTSTEDAAPLAVFSHDLIMNQTGYINYVWIDEGEFINGKWYFYKGYRTTDPELPYPDEPLLIDGLSARAYQLCFNALSEKNAASCIEKCESARWWTAYIISEVFWPKCHFGVSKVSND